MADYVDLIGAPFAHGGRGPKEFDCYGLVMEMARRITGHRLPDFGWSTEQGLTAAMMGATLPQWEEVPPGPGAVVLIRIGKYVSHVGIMIDETRMIHTWEKSGGVTVVRIEEWQQRIVGFYKHVG